MIRMWMYISFILLLTSFAGTPFQEGLLMDEICDNAIDDDNDGLIDLNDPDCSCEMVNRESLIPNPSFEDYSCCPDDASQLSCAEGWEQASGGTTDYVNTCGYLVSGERLLPFPDGEGALLFIAGTVDNGNGPEFYKEYAGACLNRPMQKDSTYRFKFYLGFLNEINSPEIRFAFFGSPSCANLPFSNRFDCPTNYPEWYFLKAEWVSENTGMPNWVEVNIVIQPTMDINALVIGADCGGSSNGMLNVYLIDDLRLNDESSFDFELVDQRSPCAPNFTFAVSDNADFSYQWYKEGIALVGEIDAGLSRMYGEGTYQLRIINENTQQCRIADDFNFTIPMFEQEIFQTICEGDSLWYEGEVIEDPGVYEYTFTSAEGCDSIVTLNVEQESANTETLSAQILPGATFNINDSQFMEEGEYRLQFTSSNGCDSIVILNLEHIKIFIPNIFTPNGDGINDDFKIFTSSDELLLTEMSIFDRWGGLLHVGNQWDGRSNNEPVNSGIYIYLIKLVDRTGEELILSNSITLVR